jgi:hypothetical protein
MKKTSQRSLLFWQNVNRTEVEWVHFLDGYRNVRAVRLMQLLQWEPKSPAYLRATLGIASRTPLVGKNESMNVMFTK